MSARQQITYRKTNSNSQTVNSPSLRPKNIKTSDIFILFLIIIRFIKCKQAFVSLLIVWLVCCSSILTLYYSTTSIHVLWKFKGRFDEDTSSSILWSYQTGEDIQKSRRHRAADKPSIDQAHSQLFTETAAYSIKMRPYLSSLFRN